VPLNQRSVWYKVEKVSMPSSENDPTDSQEKIDESVQKGSGNPSEIASLSVKDVLEKMKHPKCAKVLKIEDNESNENSSSSKEVDEVKPIDPISEEIIPSKKRKLIRPQGKSAEDWEDFKFY